jgi:hypothetical protein
VIEVAADAEPLVEHPLDLAQAVEVRVRHVEQDHFRVGPDAGRLVLEGAAAVNDADAEAFLDGPQLRAPAALVGPREARIEDLAGLRQEFLRAGVAWPDQDRSFHGVVVRLRREEPLEDRPDTSDLLNGFVCDVNEGVHYEILRL